MPRKLHIGGQTPAPEWEILDIVPGPHVDHVGNANDLSRFPDNSLDEIYASHTLEHFDYRDEMIRTLREWYRALRPFGTLYVSVPDLDTLAGLLLDKESLNLRERFHVMRMMFGGHVYQHDYHLAGLNQEFLENYLQEAGFRHLRRVEEFRMFPDASGLRFKDVPISLNMVARKLPPCS